MAEEIKKDEAVKAEAPKKGVKKPAAKKAAPKKAEGEAKAAPKKAAPKKAAPKKAEVKPEVKAEEKPVEEKKAAEPEVKETEKKALPEFKTRKPTIHDFELIYGPHVTEKTQYLQANFNKMTFRVAPDATASAVKDAVQAIFSVKVDKVNMIKVRAKAKRSSRYAGHVPGFKKAIVTVNKAYDLGEIAKAAEADSAAK